MKIGMAGYLRLHCTDPEGNVTKDTGWFPNLLTDQGLDWFGVGPPNFNIPFGQPAIATHCGVGTSSVPPTTSDTKLNAFLAMFPASSGGGVTSTGRAYVAGPPAYWSFTKTYNFTQGSVVGNVAEVGVGNTNSSDTEPQLFNHALILDQNGNPTVLPIIATDSLTVTFELRFYLDLTDNNYSIQINATNYTGVYRMSQANQVPVFDLQTMVAANTNMITYTGPLGNVNQTPVGQLSGGQSTSVFAAYVPGTRFRSVTNTFSTTNGNGSIGAFLTDAGSFGKYQHSLVPALVKTNVDTLTMTWNFSWDRFTPP